MARSFAGAELLPGGVPPTNWRKDDDQFQFLPCVRGAPVCTRKSYIAIYTRLPPVRRISTLPAQIFSASPMEGLCTVAALLPVARIVRSPNQFPANRHRSP